MVHRYDERGLLTQEIEFSEMIIDMKEELKSFFTEQRSPEEMPSRELKKQIDILKEAGAKTENF